MSRCFLNCLACVLTALAVGCENDEGLYPSGGTTTLPDRDLPVAIIPQTPYLDSVVAKKDIATSTTSKESDESQLFQDSNDGDYNQRTNQNESVTESSPSPPQTPVVPQPLVSSPQQRVVEKIEPTQNPMEMPQRLGTLKLQCRHTGELWLLSADKAVVVVGGSQNCGNAGAYHVEITNSPHIRSRAIKTYSGIPDWELRYCDCCATYFLSKK